MCNATDDKAEKFLHEAYGMNPREYAVRLTELKGGKVYFPDMSNIQMREVGTDVTIHAPVWIGNGVKIGSRVKIQAFAFIPDGVTIGDDVFIGPSVTFTNDKHPPSDKNNWYETFVHDGAVIGAGSTILPGLIIGNGAVVGAGSVVTRNVAPHATVAGNPAKPLTKD